MNTLEVYREALVKIADLANKTKMRDAFSGCFTPDHLIEPDGFVPMHPEMGRGLKFAANIARMALTAEAGTVSSIAITPRQVQESLTHPTQCTCNICRKTFLTPQALQDPS